MSAWKPVSGSPDYESGEYVAVYKRTIRGYGCYWVFRKSTPPRERTMRNALVVGSLPSLTWIERFAS